MRAVILCLFVCLFPVHGHKILCIFPAVAHSHYTLGHTLAKGLAERGHEVTFVAPFTGKEPIKNLKTVVLEGFVEEWTELQKEMDPFRVGNKPALLLPPFLGSMGIFMVDRTLSHEEIQKLLKGNERFDVVIAEQFVSEGLQAIANHFNAPSVIVSAIATSVWTNHLVGNPDIPSYMTNIYLEHPIHSNFFRRTYNTLLYIIQKLYDHLYYFPKQNEIVHKYFPNAPHIYDIMYNTSLVLCNSDISYSNALPLVPNIIEIGGIHVGDPKKLPDDLQSILNNAKNGVIYFSMGSNLKSKNFPVETRAAILKSLAKLKETVLWKFEEDLPGKPDNVVIRKWFPQSDLLAHPNVKLFITHGGMLSTIESLYRGVPVVGIPIYGDQKLNMATAAGKGYGIMIDYSTITEETLSKALNEVLNNPQYSENSKYGSKILREKQIKPMDKAEFWIDYVVRHKGAKHLRSAALELTWYQHASLDVILFLTAGTITLFLIFYIIIRWLLGRRKQLKQKKN